jgi:hypothetical protein
LNNKTGLFAVDQSEYFFVFFLVKIYGNQRPEDLGVIAFYNLGKTKDDACVYNSTCIIQFRLD